jgi:hypothetical protein
MSGRLVRIGGASGAWGDSPMAIPQLLTSKLDYLMMDYLAEVTMSLLARARLKDPSAGFPPDFIAYLKPHLAEIVRRSIRIVTNAGGVNPQACRQALEAACAELGLSPRIAVVEGDDLMPMIDRLKEAGIRDFETGAAMPDRLLTANAYLGALPIRDALAAGADIVLTGRCADSALALGPLMFEFGWADDDHDSLAAGSLVGHLLECGPQATGGIHTDWQDVPDWHNIGYPIAECRADGSFVLTKPDGTGGLVNPAVIAEQTLYEVGDPAAYMLPDVIVDLTGVTASQAGKDRVELRGARGRAPTDSYKVSATWQDGYRSVATASIVGPDAPAKAERTAAEILIRARKLFAKLGLADFSSTHVEVLGTEAAYPPGQRAACPREVVLRLVVMHQDRRALDLFARELGSIGLGFAPGTTGMFGGRPKATPQIRLFSFLVAKDALPAPTIHVGTDDPLAVSIPAGTPGKPDVAREPAAADKEPRFKGRTVEVELRRLAYARSGDKGNAANIAIISRREEYLPLLRREITAERMLAHFAGLVDGPCTRFEVPGLNAMNFLMQNALGGGGMASSRIDPQGKAFGQMALEMQVCVPQAWLDAGLFDTAETTD